MTMWSIFVEHLSSEGTRFVPKARVSYRHTSHLNRLSYIGSSDAKKDTKLLSMKLRIQSRGVRSLLVRSNQIYAADAEDAY
jgi:hypothetical protein